MLTAKIVRDVPIPHEPDEWMRLRMLSGDSLDKARDARLVKVFAAARQAGPELRAEIEAARASAPPTITLEVDPLTTFDVPTLLYQGIVAWSYDAAVSPNTIDDLDETTRDWAAKEIYALTKSTEAERKNGLSHSTVPSMESGKRRGNG